MQKLQGKCLPVYPGKIGGIASHLQSTSCFTNVEVFENLWATYMGSTIHSTLWDDAELQPSFNCHLTSQSLNCLNPCARLRRKVPLYSHRVKEHLGETKFQPTSCFTRSKKCVTTHKAAVRKGPCTQLCETTLWGSHHSNNLWFHEITVFENLHSIWAECAMSSSLWNNTW